MTLAMNKKSIIAVFVSIAVLVGVTALAWEVLTVTDPYRVEPLTSSAAPSSASVGYSVSNGSRILSIVSSGDVVVVADPGESFRYEVIWLVEQPRKDGSHNLKEFRCDLPEYAVLDQIRPLSTPVPAKIQQVADREQW